MDERRVNRDVEPCSVASWTVDVGWRDGRAGMGRAGDSKWKWLGAEESGSYGELWGESRGKPCKEGGGSFKFCYLDSKSLIVFSSG